MVGFAVIVYLPGQANQGFQGNALRFMGLVHLFQGRFEGALADFEAAMALPIGRSFSEHANYDASLLLHWPVPDVSGRAGK